MLGGCRVSSVTVATELLTGRYGDRIPVGDEIFRTLQTVPGAHPASYTVGTRSFPGVKRPKPVVNRSSNLPPSLRMVRAMPPRPPCAFMTFYKVNFTSYLRICVVTVHICFAVLLSSLPLPK